MTFLLKIALTLASILVLQQVQPMPRLSVTELWVPDSIPHESIRLKVINESDSLVVIEKVHPSCGCVLATVQRSHATKDKPGDIYVAVMTDRLSADQPVAVDVFTNRNPEVPLRLNIYRGIKPEIKEEIKKDSTRK